MLLSDRIPPNPYRYGSKINLVFHSLADGEAHTIEAITDGAYFPGAGSRALYRRRVASAIRTIRRNVIKVTFRKGDGYRMVPRPPLVS